MFCASCGTQANEAARFCSSCGKPLETSNASGSSGRVAKHVRLLGILWLALASIRIVPGLVMIIIFSTPFFPPDVPGFMRVMMPGIGAMLMIGGVLGILVGCGLLMQQPWARMLAIVVGAISLVDIPFGTAVGIYTLWVLSSKDAEQEYRVFTGTRS